MRPSLPMLGPLALSLSLLAACGPAVQEVRDEGDRFAPDRLYPMAEGNVWTFDVDDGSGENVFHYLRVAVAEGARREVTVPSGDVEVYEVRPQGIFALAHDSWVLRAPIREGEEWPARSGRVAQVASTSRSLTTEAGEFEGCVLVEEGGGESGLEVSTTYCPDVGPVEIRTRLPLDLSPQPVVITAQLRAFIVEPAAP